MAKARQIVRRRRAVTNIKKITQTMQLIATARYQKCLARAAASKPYTEKLTEMVGALAGGDAIDHPLLLKENDSAKTSILLVITSNRGLCGGYNASVLRTGAEHRRRLVAEGITPELEVVGKRAIAFLRFLQVPTTMTTTDVEDRIAFARVSEMAERFMQRYTAGELHSVDVAYTRFHSLSSQKATIAQLLPMEPPKADATQPKRTVQFEFSPEPAVLLANLLPVTVKTRLYQYFNDSIVSEQVARMIAMKQATDAAGDMIKYLTRQYNRARQSQITTELADIVGGSEAVK